MAPDFNWPIRIYYEDTDAGGIVFYTNYLKFFERARTEWLRATGVSQQAMAEQHGVGFVVKSSAVEYHAPSRLDDELKVSVTVKRLGRASVQFFQQAWCMGRSDEPLVLLASGHIKVGCVNLTTFRPAPLPSSVLDQISQYQQQNQAPNQAAATTP